MTIGYVERIETQDFAWHWVDDAHGINQYLKTTGPTKEWERAQPDTSELRIVFLDSDTE